MIHRTDITEAGVFNKPHGIKGEISATVDFDIDLNNVKCIVIDIDGIFVPFFIISVRKKTSETFLLTIDGVDSEQKARSLTGKSFYVLDDELPESDGIDGEEGFYLSDLLGFTLFDAESGKIGEITDYNDSTSNWLLIVTDESGDEMLIPVAGEYIDRIDDDDKVIFVTLPSGIIGLNSKK